MENSRILLVEDEASLLKANKAFFEEKGYEVCAANTLAVARRMMKETPPSLVVLDVMLPDGSGFDFCREVRGQSSAPVIFLTALSDLKDEEQGFSLGGDDYFVKPYDISRLEMRVSAVLRRTSSQSMGRAEIPPLSVDPAAGQCVLSGEHIFLSPMELRLLHYFMKNPNKMINRNKLYEDVWGASSSAITTTVVVHVHRLRQKLGMAEKGSYFKISSEKQDYMFSKIRY